MRVLVASLCVVVRPPAPIPSSLYQIQLGSESISFFDSLLRGIT
jgi:hypothetical protein